MMLSLMEDSTCVAAKCTCMLPIGTEACTQSIQQPSPIQHDPFFPAEFAWNFTAHLQASSSTLDPGSSIIGSNSTSALPTTSSYGSGLNPGPKDSLVFILDCVTTIWTGTSLSRTIPVPTQTLDSVEAPPRTFSAAVGHLLLDCVPVSVSDDVLRDLKVPAAELFQKCCTPADIRLAVKLAVAYRLQAKDVSPLHLPGMGAAIPAASTCQQSEILHPSSPDLKLDQQPAAVLPTPHAAPSDAEPGLHSQVGGLTMLQQPGAMQTVDDRLASSGLAMLAELVSQLISDKATQASAVGLMLHFPVRCWFWVH